MTRHSTPRLGRRLRPLVVLCALAACGHDNGTGPSTQPPAHLDAGVDLSKTATVGAPVEGGISVKVTDADGRPVGGTAVAFLVTVGSGTASPRLVTTDAKGQATTTWTLGTVAGANQLTATVSGINASLRFDAIGTPGPVAAIAVTPQSPRMVPGVDTARIAATSLDVFGNVTSPVPTLTIRDPSLISIDGGGLVHALRRGASTYVVATAAAKSDSVRVTVLSDGQSICTGSATPIELAVGQVVTDVSGSGLCVHASTTGAEYAVVPFYNNSAANNTLPVEVLGSGIAPLPLPVASLAPSPFRAPAPSVVPDDDFEARLRDRERAGIAPRVESARSWLGARRNVVPSGAQAVAVPAVGDLLKLNVNAVDFCDNPDVRVGRVTAISDKAIVVADTANPVGGFTDADYRSIGVTFDTLIDPVDRAAFGAPTDIDNNGHVILFFTRGVNELTASGASSVVLGFFYGRDLLPKTASPGPCVGSNVGEIFYLLVPDPTGIINSNKRSTTQVLTFSNGTVAHEYQHLINASRRMYVNGAGNTSEEKWLDEGLSHVAEELNFFRSSGRVPRSNLDFAGFSDPKFTSAYSTFELNNFGRYKQYLARTELQAPTGFDAFDTDLPTRGAIWNFLRFAADRLPPAQENAFWFNLVNSKVSGIANLTAALGAPPNTLLRDWAISVFMDDNAANVDPRYQQLSWNLRSAFGTSLPFPLATRFLADNVTSSSTLAGNGVGFYRFSVPASQDALITVTSGGQALPPSVQLAIVRVR